MASCGYSEIVGGSCGASSDNPANVQCVTIGKCSKDIKGHLRSYKVSDTSLDSEAKLLLARAGNCTVKNLEAYCSSLEITFCCSLSFSASK